MSGDADELLTAWRKTFGELHPGRYAEAMPYLDSSLALGVTLEQRFRELIEQEVARAIKAGSLSSPRTRILDRLAKHNPKDAE